MELLRFATAGSVDDGKSTLIGRLLYDSKQIFEDTLDALEHTSRLRGEEEMNLALLTDGLRAEREQGITIDVAYRYFATPKRKFIIADTPGHVQYTRNMVTGSSTADLAIVLIDARNGVLEQSRRHAFIATLLGIPHLVVAVNTMDGELEAAAPPLSVSILLEDNIDISRGDMICRPHNQPTIANELDAMVCWMTDTPLAEGRRYLLKHTTRTVKAIVDDLRYRI